MRIAAFDIGGTHFRYGVFFRGGLGAIHKKRTLQGRPIDLVRAVNAAVQQLSDIDVIGVSFAGATSKEGVVFNAPNIWGPDAYHIPLEQMLSEATGKPTVVINDVTAAAYREASYGVAKNAGSFLIITVSTGVGAKLFRDGDIVQGKDGITGEIGHFVIEPGSSIQCGCGGYGHLESLASGNAAARIAAETIGSMNLDRMINNQNLGQLAEQGDPIALSILHKVARPLAIGINHVWAFSKPEKVVIIGGFALNIGQQYFAALRQEILQIGLFGETGLNEAFLNETIIAGSRDDMSGLVGAGAAAERIAI